MTCPHCAINCGKKNPYLQPCTPNSKFNFKSDDTVFDCYSYISPTYESEFRKSKSAVYSSFSKRTIAGSEGGCKLYGICLNTESSVTTTLTNEVASYYPAMSTLKVTKSPVK